MLATILRRLPTGAATRPVLTGAILLAVAGGLTTAATSASAAPTAGRHIAAAHSMPPSAASDPNPTPSGPAPTDRTVSAGVRVEQATTTRLRQMSFTTIAPGVDVAAAYGPTFSGAHGAYIRFAPGASVPRHHYTAALHGVLLAGRLANVVEGEPSTRVPLRVGDSFALPRGAKHTDRCVSAKPCLLFTYQDFGFEPVLD